MALRHQSLRALLARPLPDSKFAQCKTKTKADFVGRKSPLLDRIRPSPCSPFRICHHRTKLHSSLHTTSSDDPCRRRDCKVLLQGSCRGHHKRTRAGHRSWFGSSRGMGQRPRNARQGANEDSRELGALGSEVPVVVRPSGAYETCFEGSFPYTCPNIARRAASKITTTTRSISYHICAGSSE